MNELSDQELLRSYAACGAEGAFAELVRRHVDLVHSSAVRMLRDVHLAEDVTQRVFVALARNSGSVCEHPVLAGWLHQTTRNIAAHTVRTEARRRAREREAAVLQSLVSPGTEPSREDVSLVLDAALGELSAADRDVILLRYFEQRSAKETGARLGISDEAAQKRTHRAMKRLREILRARGVVATETVVVAVLGSSTAQAAPASVVAGATAAAVSAGSALVPIATQVLAMTSLQKIVVVTAVTLAAGAGIFEATQATALRDRAVRSESARTELAASNEALRTERDKATERLAAVNAENEQLRLARSSADQELQKVRAELASLKETAAEESRETDPFAQVILALAEKAADLNEHLQQAPATLRIPELQFLDESDWLRVAQNAKFGSPEEVRKALSDLRWAAKAKAPIYKALAAYLRANDRKLPVTMAELKPYFVKENGIEKVDPSSLDALLSRYSIVKTGKASDHPKNTWFIVETAPVDPEWDTRAKFGDGSSMIVADYGDGPMDPEDPAYGARKKKATAKRGGSPGSP